MGNRSFNTVKHVKPVNYNCPNCMETSKNNIPNLAGRFFLINDKECQCNGCNTIYPKGQFYTHVITDAKPS
jgi:hypothetical protein